MNKKVIVGLAVVSVLSSVALANFAIEATCDYNAGNYGQAFNSGAPIWMQNGSTIWATISGVGMGGGAAYAQDTDTGAMIAFVNTGGSYGQSYYQEDTENVTVSPGENVRLWVNISGSSSGAHGFSEVEAAY